MRAAKFLTLRIDYTMARANSGLLYDREMRQGHIQAIIGRAYPLALECFGMADFREGS